MKAIPGADPELIERVGFLADRMSVNLELPTADGLARLAPGKTRDKILRPMRQIQTGIARQLEQEGRLESRGGMASAERARRNSDSGRREIWNWW